MDLFDKIEKLINKLIGENPIITSIEEAEVFHKKCIQIRTDLFLHYEIMPHYRGEQQFGWNITPGIFRLPDFINDPLKAKSFEKNAIIEFEKTIIEKVGTNVLRQIFMEEKNGKAWDLLFQAQHAGVKTTLVDWSPFIDRAMYFATEESEIEDIENSDGQLWVFLCPTSMIMGHDNFPTRNSYYDLDPFEMTETILINSPTYIDNIKNRIFEYRMYSQFGRFILCSNKTCHIPINEQEEFKPLIIRVKIPSEFKKKIRIELAAKGLTRQKIYIDENPARQDLISDINKKIYNI